MEVGFRTIDPKPHQVHYFRKKEEDDEEVSTLFNDHIVGCHGDRALLLVYPCQRPKALPDD